MRGFVAHFILVMRNMPVLLYVATSVENCYNKYGDKMSVNSSSVSAEIKAEKSGKVKKSLWKKLLIILVAVAVFFIGIRLIFNYFSDVVCENLSSIAESIDYIEKGNDKITLGNYFESVDELFNQSANLSAYAYDAQDDTLDWKGEFEKLGFENVMHYNNEPSQLYKSLSKKNKSAATMLSPVNATVASKNMQNYTLIAVAFKGTDSSNINDDLSDMYKAVDKNGFHKGFLFNAKQFDKKSDGIVFLINGVEVPLDDVVEEMKNKNSSYKMLVTGHSLGAAVADVYVGYILAEKGVDPSNVVAVTFGAPKSCAADYNYSEDNIINIINTDDLVPTIGAEKHIGTCLYFTPADNFRKEIYGDKYIEPNEYNSYSDLISSVKSDLVAHNLRGTYIPVCEKILSDKSDYFTNYADANFSDE